MELKLTGLSAAEAVRGAIIALLFITPSGAR
jgi:hypothetical protein